MADPLGPTKPMPQKISVLSSAFLLAISLSLIFFSFYFLSFRNTIFWFVLSNAIIFLIAAADSESAHATPSFKHKPDLYDEYLRSIRSGTSFSAPVPEARAEDKKDPDCADSPPPQEPVPESTQKEACQEETEKKAIVAVDNGGLRSDGGDSLALSVEELNRRAEDPESTQKEACQEETEKKAIVAFDNGGLRPDGGDFLALPVEELNRRAEDFIRRFNREIRLQEMERKRLKQM